ncbi:unnamed protein product [Rhizoctonia solani]|uniref:Fungal lipase-type domain-containing protein n=1 Tax=Rhizoctonia solani TaxID=456999 RepID=A0A8H2XUF8_9AGAM|nr:unnamed protein product [Rhizoctonia solani]
MSIPDDNAHRQVFGISLIANAIRKIEGSEEKLQGLAEKRIPELLHERLPGWEVVWGPRVWKYRREEITTGPDHVFYVARNPNLEFPNEGKKDTYVLGIAATATPYNWLGNNARVDKVVDLYKWLENGISTDPTPLGGLGSTPGSSYIALGTALGVYRLASLASPTSGTAKSPGVALPAYWASFPESPDTKVILTGHSLGGALSPTLALGLLESNGFAKFKPKNVLVYPTAGPTAGNLVFAKLYSSRFPKVPGPGYQVWNCNIVNRLDVVSQAWCTSEHASPEQNMQRIPPIYGKPIDEVKAGVNGGIFWASLCRTTYMPIQAAWFRGTPPQTAPINLDEFKAVAKEQHVNEFYKLFNVKITEKDVLTGAGGDFGPITDSEERTEPVLSEIVALMEVGQRQDENPQDYVAYLELSGDFE